MAYFSHSPTLSSPAGSLDLATMRSMTTPAPGDLGFVKAIPSGGHQGKLGFNVSGSNYRRAYFYGVVTNNGFNFDAGTAEIQAQAALLSRLGFNAVRFHLFDDSTQNASAGYATLGGSIAKFDEAIYEFKNKGLYCFIDLFTKFREFNTTFDSVNAAANGLSCLELASPYAYFDNTSTDVFQLMKNFVSNVLNRTNSFLSNVAYKDEKAIAAWVLPNEASLVLFWRRDWFNAETMVAFYKDKMNASFQAWLQGTGGPTPAKASSYASLSALNTAWNTSFTAWTEVLVLKWGSMSVGNRMRDTAEFMMALQLDFEKRLTDYIKTIDANHVVIGSDSNASWAMPPVLNASSYADAVCGNYYDGNEFDAGNGNYKWDDRSMIVRHNATDAGFKMLPRIFALGVKQKAACVMEHNSVWPKTFNYEALPMGAAYGCLQDLDAMFVHKYNPGNVGNNLSVYDSTYNPIRRSQIPLAASIFLRRDVRPGWSVALPHNKTGSGIMDLTQLLTAGEEATYGAAMYANSSGANPNLPVYAGFRRRLLREFVASGADLDWKSRWLDPDPYGSTQTLHSVYDLRLDGSATQLWTINTPNTQGAIGLLNGLDINTTYLADVRIYTITLPTAANGAAIMVTSIDQKPVKTSRRLLVSACGHMKTSGAWAVTNTSPSPDADGLTKQFAETADWGTTPYLVESCSFVIRITWTDGALAGLTRTVYPLNANGERGTSFSMSLVSSNVYEVTIDTNTYAALSYEIVI